MLAIWSLVPLPFLNPTWTFGQFTYSWSLRSLENFEHYFASMWDECNCAVIWTFFGIASVWGWNGNWRFPVLWPLLSFTNFLAYWVQHFHHFCIWNSSAGILSPPLALSTVMLPKAHLMSHSRMYGSRWVITPSWLSGPWRSFLYSPSVYPWHLFLISLLPLGLLLLLDLLQLLVKLLTTRGQIQSCLKNQTVRNLRKVKESLKRIIRLYKTYGSEVSFLVPSLRGKKKDTLFTPMEKASGKLLVAMGVSPVEETCLSLHHKILAKLQKLGCSFQREWWSRTCKKKSSESLRCFP